MITAANQPHSNTNCSNPLPSQDMPGAQKDFLLFFIPLCSVAQRNSEAQLLSGSASFLLTMAWSSVLAAVPHTTTSKGLSSHPQSAAGLCILLLVGYTKTVATTRRIKKGTPLSTCIKGFISYFLSHPPTPLPAPALEVYVHSPSRGRDMQGRGWQGTD